MAQGPTAREQAREKTNREILRIGREQLGEVGAAALSLRAVARELGMVSSAIYRYVPSRDELLTLLIDDAYNSLGDAVDGDVADTANDRAIERWVSAAHAIRRWALEHPHEYSLLYGSPVPGYAAPARTAVSGTRATRSLVSIVSDARRNKQLTARRGTRPEIDPGLATDFANLRTAAGLDLDDGVVLDVLIAWSQIFGLVSFELFSQTRGIVEYHEALFDAAVRRLATAIGLT